MKRDGVLQSAGDKNEIKRTGLYSFSGFVINVLVFNIHAGNSGDGHEAF